MTELGVPGERDSRRRVSQGLQQRPLLSEGAQVGPVLSRRIDY